jgi:transcriptional regulator with PAS, ATPase and Fis domain
MSDKNEYQEEKNPVEDKQFYETIFDSVADGVFTVDAQRRITSFNRAAERITGLSKSEAIGKQCSDVFQSNICETGCALRQTLETGNKFIGSLNALSTQFKSVNTSEPAKPFDIRDYQITLIELSNSAQELTKLADSLERISDKVVANQLIPQVENALDRAESKGEELIDYTMRQMTLLIVIGLIGYIIAKLFIRYFSTKMKAPGK